MPRKTGGRRIKKPFSLRVSRTDGFLVAIDDAPAGLKVVVSRGDKAWTGVRATITEAVALSGKIAEDQKLIDLMHAGDKNHATD